tara:strand:- start:115 stop:414 length:300 start_codon:yes stop_codon:yes gene_type:complete
MGHFLHKDLPRGHHKGLHRDPLAWAKALLGCLQGWVRDLQAWLQECPRHPVAAFLVLRVALHHLFRVCVTVGLSVVGASKGAALSVVTVGASRMGGWQS